MAEYKNASLGVVNAGGTFILPGQTGDLSDKTPGIERLVKRGLLQKAESSDPKADPKAEPKAKTEKAK